MMHGNILFLLVPSLNKKLAIFVNPYIKNESQFIFYILVSIFNFSVRQKRKHYNQTIQQNREGQTRCKMRRKNAYPEEMLLLVREN
jgi:hypothetical protein